MSNDKAVKSDELETKVNNDEPKVDPKDSTESDEVDAAQEAHKQEVFEGMIRSNLEKIARGELKFEDVKGEKMKSEVQSRLKQNLAFLNPEKSKQEIDEDALLTKFEERAELKSILNEVAEDERDLARQEYESLKASRGHAEALKAVQKLHEIESAEEKRSYSERVHKVGVASKTLDAIDSRKLNSTEKAMIEYAKAYKKK
jgi:hypothetical protein